MYIVRLLPLALVLLLSAAPAEHSVGWGEWVMNWFTGWFTEAETAQPAAVKVDRRERPEEFSLPLPEDVAMLAAIPASDTATIGHEWPLLTVDAVSSAARRERLLGESVVVANPDARLPLLSVPAVRILYPEGQRPERFIEMARRFADVQDIAFTSRLAPALAASTDVPTLVVATDPPGLPTTDDWYRALYTIGDYTLIHFGNKDNVRDVPAGWAFVNCPLRSNESESFLSQAIFGAQGLGSIDEDAKSGIEAVRPGFREPEAVGIDRRELERLDRTINRAIRSHATPGAQLTVMKDGEVVYERAYGRHRYGAGSPVRVSDLYDLASLTKAAATTLAIMKLYDEGRIDLEARASHYLPEYEGQVPGRYTIDQLLSHHTGMQQSLPLYPYLQDGFLAERRSPRYDLPMSASRYADISVPSRLRKDLAKVDYTRRPVHRYSDINFVVLQYVVEAITGQELDQYVNETIYRPLGLQHLAFRPAKHFPTGQTVPTVVDSWLGRDEVRGYVHDEGAALLGGVAGHAGLFGNATDVARLFQLLLDGGAYAGRQLISRETISLFTDRNAHNERALGFDRLDSGYHSVVRAGAGERTFGHTGFTGTCVWADPENDLVFVLLTNRTYPDPANDRLQKMGVRSRVHRDLYRALDTYRPATPA